MYVLSLREPSTEYGSSRRQNRNQFQDQKRENLVGTRNFDPWTVVGGARYHESSIRLGTAVDYVEGEYRQTYHSTAAWG